MSDENLVDEPESNQSGWDWRAIAAGIFVILIGFFAFFLVQQRLNSDQDESGSGSQEIETATSAKTQFELGNTLYESGQLDQAVAAFQQAIELDPNYQAAYANLGVTYYQQQKFDLAASQYKKAMELDPEDGDVAYNLGALYLQQALSQANQPDADLVNTAISQLEKAMQLSPDLAEPHFTLGVAYMALDQKAQAVESFNAFLSLNTDTESIANQEAENYLKLLGEE